MGPRPTPAVPISSRMNEFDLMNKFLTFLEIIKNIFTAKRSQVRMRFMSGWDRS